VQHPIGDHALLADGRTAALVDPGGNIAWLCWPRIDSSPCLLGLLDDVVGGMFVLAPVDPGATIVERAYEPGTLILRTVWRTSGGELTVRDALACDGPPRLVRSLRAHGSIEVAARVALAPDAARVHALPVVDGAALRVTGSGLDVAVHAPHPWTIDSHGVAECRFRATGTLAAFVFCDGHAEDVGRPLDGTSEWFADRVPAASSLVPNEVAARTLGDSTARAMLQQSAAVLAGLHQRRGGIVAAPTTSLPQWPGSSRTWDYRYSWLRDTAHAALAMLRCGLLEDAAGLGSFIGTAIATLPPAVLRRVDGTAPPAERILDHLRGYGGARPVRFGNAASEQPQLDVAGEVLELAAGLAAADALPAPLGLRVAGLADWTADHWADADHGIWEIRGPARRYTHSRVLAWAGLVQAAALSVEGVIDGQAARWRAAADAIRADVLRSGGPLTLHDGGGGPDSALAQAALTGFLEVGDPRLAATLDSITGTLERGGLIDRHVAEEDTLSDPCAPFIFPTFWVAEALQRCGRDGSRYFAAAAASGGALTLFGEVADPRDHSPLGNYPQVQSHAAFILAAADHAPS
jgi:GH15 family glucan-1,4-alpha-glucosidase